MTEIIQLDQEVAKTCNNLRISIRNSRKKNDGRYDRLIAKEEKLLRTYMNSIREAA